MGRGINLGDMLDAPNEGDWGVGAEPRLVQLAAKHFQTVRVPVRWSNHASPDAEAVIDPVFMKRVESVVDELLAREVVVVLDMHHYNQLTGQGLHPREFVVEASLVEPRFLAMWRQIARRFAGKSPRLILELYNEPSGKAMDAGGWNTLAAKALAVVRESNPTRTVMIGPADWNSVRRLSAFRLPDDRNLVVAIHSYEPIQFTHQGASWVFVAKDVVDLACCDAAQTAQIRDVFDTALKWSEAKGYPIYLGEFGSYPKAPLQSRVRYARLVREMAESRRIPWAYWSLANGFGVYQAKTDAWIEPLRAALLDP